MIQFQLLNQAQESQFRQLLQLFGEVFEEPERYHARSLSDEYINEFLANSCHLVLVAVEDQKVVGGMVVYLLTKFEQARKELFVYDLAVSKAYQRKGIATGLVTKLVEVGKERNANLVFVLADKQDEGAIAFYRSITRSELDTVQFEIQL